MATCKLTDCRKPRSVYCNAFYSSLAATNKGDRISEELLFDENLMPQKKEAYVSGEINAENENYFKTFLLTYFRKYINQILAKYTAAEAKNIRWWIAAPEGLLKGGE